MATLVSDLTVRCATELHEGAAKEVGNKPDGYNGGGYPFWHGWALRDCIEIGYKLAIADAAKAAEAESKAAHLETDRWDIGYRKACENIAAAIRELAE